MNHIERVTEVSQSRNVRENLSSISSKLQKLNDDISSGVTVRTASDDPLAINKTLNFKASQSSLLQYKKNITIADSIVNFSTKALEGINDVLVRSQELAVLASTNLAPDSFGSYATEVNQLLEQIVSLSNQQYLDQFLFAGTNTNTPPFSPTRDSSGKISAVTFTGNTSQAQIQLDANTTISPFADSQTTTSLLDSINSLISLRNGMQAQDPNTIQSLQTTQLIPGSNNLGLSIARLGAISSRINFASASNDTFLLNIEASISKEISTDIASSIISHSQLQLAYEVSSSLYGKVLKKSGLVDILRSSF